MSKNTETACPCGSGKENAECCLPYIQGVTYPDTAEKLMRSRYTAFALLDYSYIFKTWHSDHRPSMSELKSDRNPPKWVKLNITDVQKGAPDDNYGEVEFEAYFEQSEDKHILYERSEFLKENNKWVYTIGVNKNHRLE